MGTELQGLFKKFAPEAKVLLPTSSEFNVRNLDQCRKYCEKHNVKAILHCAAFTAVPKAEVRPFSENFDNTSNSSYTPFNLEIF